MAEMVHNNSNTPIVRNAKKIYSFLVYWIITIVMIINPSSLKWNIYLEVIWVDRYYVAGLAKGKCVLDMLCENWWSAIKAPCPLYLNVFCFLTVGRPCLCHSIFKLITQHTMKDVLGLCARMPWSLITLPICE